MPREFSETFGSSENFFLVMTGLICGDDASGSLTTVRARRVNVAEIARNDVSKDEDFQETGIAALYL